MNAPDRTTPGSRREACEALREEIDLLDAAYAAVHEVRPVHASYWETTARPMFLAVTSSRGGISTVEIWDAVADLREIRQKYRAVALDELGLPADEITW